MGWWSWFLAAFSLFGMWSSGSGRPWGWLVNLASELCWIPYALVTKQHGFLLLIGGYAVVYVRNYVRNGRRVVPPHGDR